MTGGKIPTAANKWAKEPHASDTTSHCLRMLVDDSSGSEPHQAPLSVSVLLKADRGAESRLLALPSTGLLTGALPATSSFDRERWQDREVSKLDEAHWGWTHRGGGVGPGMTCEQSPGTTFVCLVDHSTTCPLTCSLFTAMSCRQAGFELLFKSLLRMHPVFAVRAQLPVVASTPSSLRRLWAETRPG